MLYDTIQEFNTDGKAECGQLNLAHVIKSKKCKKKLKQTNASTHLVPVQVQDPQKQSRKIMEERFCETDEF